MAVFSHNDRGSGWLRSQSIATLQRVSDCRRTIRQGRLPDFDSVMSLTYSADATESLDRIYGCLAITQELVHTSQTSIRVDYNISLDALYTQVTATVTHQRKNLSFLSLVCERKDVKVVSLPSWCPDYGARAFLLTQHNADALGNLGTTWSARSSHLVVTKSKHLAVEGVPYDMVSCVTKTGLKEGHSNGWESLVGVIQLAASLRWQGGHEAGM